MTWTHLPPGTCSPGFPPAGFQVLLSLFPLPGMLFTAFFTWLTLAHPSGFSSVVNLFRIPFSEPPGRAKSSSTEGLMTPGAYHLSLVLK